MAADNRMHLGNPADHDCLPGLKEVIRLPVVYQGGAGMPC